MEDHAYDTMKGSDYLGDAPAVEALCRESPEEVIRLEHWGMPFSREDDGRVSQRPFGGPPSPDHVRRRGDRPPDAPHDVRAGGQTRITVYDEWHVMELAVTDEDDPADRTCHGVVAYDIQSGEISGFSAKNGVILATGGMGQVFDHTTNAVANTGDGVAMAYRAGVLMEDMEFIQFHPTTLRRRASSSPRVSAVRAVSSTTVRASASCSSTATRTTTASSLPVTWSPAPS